MLDITNNDLRREKYPILFESKDEKDGWDGSRDEEFWRAVRELKKCYDDINQDYNFSFVKFLDVIFDKNLYTLNSDNTFYTKVDTHFWFRNEKRYFKKNCNFSNSFFRYLDFSHTIFEEKLIFEKSKFESLVLFNCTIFKRLANFSDFNFVAEAQFYESIFESSCVFYRVNFSGVANFLKVIFKDMVTFREITFESDTVFSKSIFEATIIFQSAFFQSPYNSDVQVDFSESHINKITFFNCNFNHKTFFNRCIAEKFYIDMSSFAEYYSRFSIFKSAYFYGNSSFKKIDIEGSIFEKVLFNNTKILKLNRETAIIIKHSYDQAGDYIRANEYYSREMDEYAKEIAKESWATHFEDKAVFYLSKYISNFSQSFLLPLFWMLFFSWFFYLFHWMEMGYLYEQYSLDEIFRFSSPLSHEYFTEKYIPFKWWFFHKLFLSVLMYHFVVALRRQTKR